MCVYCDEIEKVFVYDVCVIVCDVCERVFVVFCVE